VDVGIKENMAYNLRKRNIIMVDWFYMCKKSGESIDHLLLHYEVARDFWNSLLNMFGVVWVMFRKGERVVCELGR
jgi:hypothetical protein